MQKPHVASRIKGLRQFLTPEQQRDWVEGRANLTDADERSESLEQRCKYVARLEKLLRRPQAQEVLENPPHLRRKLLQLRIQAQGRDDG